LERKTYKSKNHKKPGKNAVFIDEIQDINQFEKALRSIYSESQYDIYCTGSNANMLSGELATYLSGRFIEIRIHPLSFNEFLKSQKINITSNMVLDYLFYLRNAYFINKTQRMDIIGKKIFEIGDKYYFEDIGLRNSINGFKKTDINKFRTVMSILHKQNAIYC